MKISTSELKRFKANSAFIKKRGIIPILDYLKFDEGKITKTNLQSFVEMKANFKGCFLVPEMNLFNFLSRSTEDYVDVYVKDGMCIISDGKLPVVKVPTEDIKNFPAIPVPDEEEFELSNEVFCAINAASNFVDSSDAPDIKCHVFVGDELVAGMNGWVGYIEKIKTPLPKISIYKEVAMVVGKFPEGKFLQNERNIFFDIYDTRYSFLKAEYPYTNLNRFGIIDESWAKVEVNKEAILDFTETCVTQNVEKNLTSVFSMKGNKLLMSMNERNYNIAVNHSVEVKGGLVNEFIFQPSFLSNILKNLPDKNLIVYQSDQALHITGESGALASIQKMVINN